MRFPWMPTAAALCAAAVCAASTRLTRSEPTKEYFRKLIHLYKYGKVKTLARPLSGLLAQALPRDEAFDAAVPVPLYWRRACREVSIRRNCWRGGYPGEPAFPS